MTELGQLRRHGRIDEVADLEAMDIIALNDSVNPYGEGDAFAAAGFRLGREVFRAAIDRWGFSGLGAVAEVPCGFGRWSMFLAEANNSVHGYDSNFKCVGLASKLATYLDLKNATFETALTGAIPAPDDAFDGIWSFNAMSRLDRDETLREMHRIMRPGGRLFLGRYDSIGAMLETFLTGYRRGGLGHSAAQFALRGLIAGPLFDDRGNYGSPEHIAAVLERHGFELAEQPPMVSSLRGEPLVDWRFLGEISDISAVAARLAGDREFAEAFVDNPLIASIYPFHLDLLAVKKTQSGPRTRPGKVPTERSSATTEQIAGAVEEGDTRGAARARRPYPDPTAIIDDRPFSPQNALHGYEKSACVLSWARVSLRPLPFPFASAVAVVSDVDGSMRGHYRRYIGLLVGDLGLDFGDSTWLVWRQVSTDDGAVAHGAGFGFFSPNFAIAASGDPEVYETTRTFAENVAEFHSGNIDHFHSFLPRGPRVIVADRWTRSGNSIEIDCTHFQLEGRWGCKNLPLLGIGLLAAPGVTLRQHRVAVFERTGRMVADFREIGQGDWPGGGAGCLLTLIREPEADVLTPTLDRIEKIVIDLDGEVSAVQKVLLLNATGSMVLERLWLLREQFGIEMPLVTDHSSFHFRNSIAAVQLDALQARKAASHPGVALALWGTFRNEEGRALFTTEADDPRSVCCVFPELSEALEVRFVNPAGYTASSQRGWHILDVVRPARVRAGTGIYVAGRTNVQDLSSKERFFPAGERFAFQVDCMLKYMREEPGFVWPVYTHLGSLSALSDRDAEKDELLPSPYFDLEPLQRLQDRVFNISGNTPPEERVWFTRGSVLYDYALVMRDIAGNTERPDPDTVRIRSWFDRVLDKTLPRSPTQLYGLTFYVDDPANAAVWLDDKPLAMLARNPPDETGRPSVTIAECDIRITVFSRLDPAAGCEEAGSIAGGRWAWRDGDGSGLAYGRLTSDGGLCTLALPLHNLAPDGAQLLSFVLRRDADAQFGFLFATRGGGRFFFGDRGVAEQIADGATATYFFAQHCPSPGEWQQLVAPFHDLTWRNGARTGGPMPNHPLESLTIACIAPDCHGIDIGRLAFLRPRATALSSQRSFCVVGSIPGFTPGQRVYLLPVATRKAPPRVMPVDARGHFCFAAVPSGIYRLWTVAAAGERCNRRGPLIEVESDVVNLVLDAENRMPPKIR